MTTETVQARCRRLATSLIELGEDAEGVERQLVRWGFDPSLSRETAAWADQQAVQATEER